MHRFTLLALLGALACGEPMGPAPSQVQASGTKAANEDLLVEARATIQGGRLSSESVAKIMGSRDPRHARARRLLAALDDESVAPSETTELVAVQPPAQGGVSPEAGRQNSSNDGPVLAGPELESMGDDPVPKPQGLLTGLSMVQRPDGVTLTVKVSDRVKIGVVRIEDGRVRLVVPGRATRATLGARPKVSGVAVTDVRAGTGTVLVNIDLEPGWEVGEARGFAGGTRIRFRGPGG